HPAAAPRAAARPWWASGPRFEDSLAAAGVAVNATAGKAAAGDVAHGGRDCGVDLCQHPASRTEPSRHVGEKAHDQRGSSIAGIERARRLRGHLGGELRLRGHVRQVGADQVELPGETPHEVALDEMYA